MNFDRKLWMKDYMRSYQQSHREDVNARASAYRSRNRDECNARVAKCRRDRLIKWPWYGSYTSAKSRCNNVNNKRYYDYGGRGIRFLLTHDDMAYLWVRDCADLMVDPTIDRKNSDGDYILSNCRFVERVENSRCGGLTSTSRKYAK